MLFQHMYHMLQQMKRIIRVSAQCCSSMRRGLWSALQCKTVVMGKCLAVTVHECGAAVDLHSLDSKQD